jgi:hypothetical protein
MSKRDKLDVKSASNKFFYLASVNEMKSKQIRKPEASHDSSAYK